MKRCPFEDHEQDKLEVIAIDNDFAVLCNCCGALGPESNTEQGAIDAWNHRIEDD